MRPPRRGRRRARAAACSRSLSRIHAALRSGQAEGHEHHARRWRPRAHLDGDRKQVPAQEVAGREDEGGHDRRGPQRRPDGLGQSRARATAATRRQPAGNRTTVEARPPARACRWRRPAGRAACTSAMLSARLRSPPPMLVNATSRCSPAPLRSVPGRGAADADDHHQRQQLQHQRRCRRSRVPTQARTSGSAMQDHRPAQRHDGAERQPRALHEDRLQPVEPRRRVVVDDGGEQDVVQLVGQPLRHFGEPLTDRSTPQPRSCSGTRRSRSRRPSNSACSPSR